jgi:hypothetical protein
MNTLLFQMIAARASSNNNPAVAEMLARLNGSPGANPIAVPQQLLAQVGGGNPLLSALSKHLAEIQTNGSTHTTARTIDIEPEPEHAQAIDRSKEVLEEGSSNAVNELREDLKNLSAELKALRERNDLLAATLGACCLCWGQDPECRACRGRGRPGYAMADEALFGEFVLPAIRMLRAQRAKLGGASVAGQQKPAEASAQLSDRTNHNERTSICQ